MAEESSSSAKLCTMQLKVKEGHWVGPVMKKNKNNNNATLCSGVITDSQPCAVVGTSGLKRNKINETAFID
jgi:hypothetical protein